MIIWKRTMKDLRVEVVGTVKENPAKALVVVGMGTENKAIEVAGVPKYLMKNVSGFGKKLSRLF
jgi:hypothetical protein